MATQLRAGLAEDYENMTPKQKQVIMTSYEHGKPFDWGYTLAAIAWEESQGGKHLLNVFDPSYGIYHIQLDNALKYENKKENTKPFTKYKKNIIAGMLISNHKYQSLVAMSVLEYFKTYYKGSWSKAVASYNGGFKGNKQYLRKIKKKIKFLKGVLK